MQKLSQTQIKGDEAIFKEHGDWKTIPITARTNYRIIVTSRLQVARYSEAPDIQASDV